MSLLNYWYNKLNKLRSDTMIADNNLQNQINSIIKFKLSTRPVTITISELAPDDSTDTIFKISEQSYPIGIAEVTPSESYSGFITAILLGYARNSNGELSCKVTISNDTAHFYTGNITLLIVCLELA